MYVSWFNTGVLGVVSACWPCDCAAAACVGLHGSNQEWLGQACHCYALLLGSSQTALTKAVTGCGRWVHSCALPLLHWVALAESCQVLLAALTAVMFVGRLKLTVEYCCLCMPGKRAVSGTAR
jgi:hypothetical protein